MRVPVVVVALATTACLEDYASTDYEWRRSAQNDPSSSFLGPGNVGPTPEFGVTARAHPAPPPLSGGTLAAVPGRTIVVAADPDRDVVYVVDVERGTFATVALAPGDEPGRVVVDESQRAHVALRSGAALATIDLERGNAVTKRAVCTLPRGVAWEKETGEVHVACAGGELVTLDAAGGPPKRSIHVARDLRDVVVTPRGLVVSTFRDAHVIRLAKDGSVDAQSRGPRGVTGLARVAWRMIASPSEATLSDDPGDSVMMAAQQTPSELSVPPPAPPAYYESESGCSAGGPLTLVTERREPLVVPNAVLPVDIATDGVRIVVVSAGNAHVPDRPQLVYLLRSSFTFACDSAGGIFVPPSEITSVVHEPNTDRFYALSREPAALHVIDLRKGPRTERSIALSDVSKRDTGHAIFHASSGRGGTACASCHPEGRDDGHSWRSQQLGPRRTPSLVGTVAGTAPYHWNGEASGLDDLMNMTFTQRMRGPELTSEQKSAVASWLGELPALRRGSSSSLSFSPAILRGRRIFEGASARCSSCHAGPLFTNNATLDVGTGGDMQVPSLLGVAHHPPYLHDGSYPHLRSVIRNAHGGAFVRDDELDDLVTYLESL